MSGVCLQSQVKSCWSVNHFESLIIMDVVALLKNFGKFVLLVMVIFNLAVFK